MLRRCLIALIALTLMASAGFAQQAVPAPEEFLGYRLGDRFTPHHRILDYFGELTKRSPLITMETFGQTYERRPLVLTVITSAKNRASLDSIRANVNSLAGGDAVDANRAGEIARSSPAVVWLAFGVHGNESSSAEAAMLVASSLLRDSSLSALLDNLVILIDPLQNPDGRERYAQWFHRTRGEEANPNADAFEHFEPWPGGRYNHYQIDMNRDWTWMSQRETQARVDLYRRWHPQVFVDFHEMSFRSNYFFPPDAKPINQNLPPDLEKWLERFGRANAEVFSNRGWQFFVGENFDLFYPGYGDSWPALNGAVGMTYEVAGGGRGGSVVEREDGTTLTLRDRVERHHATAMATLRTAAEHREELLRYTNAAMRVHSETGKNTFLLIPGSPNFSAIVDNLQRQGVRVSMLTAPASLRATRIDRETAESRSFPQGTAVVTTRQPLGGLVQTLLERNATFQKGYLEEQRAKAEADEPEEFYDLTAWSMPLAMNVEAYVTTASIPGQVASFNAPAVQPFSAASYGYLVSGHDPNLYRFLGRLLRAGIRFHVADAELPFGEQSWPRGSVVILKANNAASLDDRIGIAVRETPVALVPLQAGWIGSTTFGSERIRSVKEPKIGLVGGPGSGATSYGMLWHTLDVDTPIPHTILALDSLRTIDLSRYNVLVFPDGDYSERLRKREIEKLQVWLRNGGTIVAVKGASGFLRSKDSEMSKLKNWNEPKKEKKADAAEEEEAEEEEETTDRYNEFRIPGSAFRTAMNERSYLTFGVPRPPAVLIEGTTAFKPLGHRVDNIVTIEKTDMLVSGVAWPESLERIAGAVYLSREPYGRGSVITFADDPHFRLFWRGTLPLFLNAVIYSPSYPR